MASVLLPLLLRVLLLAITPGSSPIPTVSQDCNAAAKVVKAGKTGLIYDTQVTKKSNGYPYSELKPIVKLESGFTGLHLIVTGSDGNDYLAWFPKDSECFPDHDKWYKLKLEAGIRSDQSTLFLIFRNGACAKGCKLSNPPQDIRSFGVVAHGPSKWLLEPPPTSCDYIHPEQRRLPTLTTCKQPPHHAYKITEELTTLATTPAIATTTTPEPRTSFTTTTIITTTTTIETSTTLTTTTTFITTTTTETPTAIATATPSSTSLSAQRSVSVTVVVSVVLVVVLVVVAMVVAAVLFWTRRKHQQSATPRDPASLSRPTEPASNIYATENEMYMYQLSDRHTAAVNASSRH